MFGIRSLKRNVLALFGKQHYIALFNMIKTYPSFSENLLRYLIYSGDYPYNVKINTPTGLLQPKLYGHYDMVTVNEIFCRHDYLADENIKTVIDLGSNIGISALYFLSRNNYSKCYLFEPNGRNIAKLKENLSGFEERYSLVEKAVADESGQFEFGIEPTGRYGGIGIKTEESIIVDCLEVNEVIKEVLAKEDFIDILKIDTEGAEERTVRKIKPDLLKKIGIIYLEAKPKGRLHPDIFTQKQYGSVCQLFNKNTH